MYYLMRPPTGRGYIENGFTPCAIEGLGHLWAFAHRLLF
ncbi:TPA_asm: hypothetical protein [Porphyromonas phage phage017a_JCVISC001]|uniref:Uncharacterized protein n=1 Tax=Porphyromonas phage phage017a_JCVISC001 TaxID=3154107 RepID=A0AAT9J8J1_9CAUD